MFRFSAPRSQPNRRTPLLALRMRFFLLAAAMLLIVMARTELRRPAVHAAIGRMLEGPAAEEKLAVAKVKPILFDAALLNTVQDNTFFREEEQPAWFAMLAELRDTNAEHLASNGTPISYAQLVSQPDVYRGRLVRVAGEVLRVETVTPAKNDLGITHLYRVTLKPVGGGVWPLTLYTLQPPPGTVGPNEPYSASASGFFFKNLSYRWEEGVGVTPVVLAQRLETTLVDRSKTIASVPSPVASSSATGERKFDLPTGDSLGRSLLKELGIEAAVFAPVVDQRPLTAQEREAFYAVLKAVGETPATQLVRLAQRGLGNYAARQQVGAKATARQRLTASEVARQANGRRYSVAPLFGDGPSQRGELVVFDAIVRRVVRIEVADDSVSLDHYYELEAFPEDSQNLPLVFCMRELPEGFPIGEGIRQPARMAGFFFKQWVYRTRKPGATGGDLRQYAPLLIGRAPMTLATPRPADQRPGAVIGLLGAGLLLATVAWLWRSSRADRRYKQSTLRRIRRETDGDFSKLP